MTLSGSRLCRRGGVMLRIRGGLISCLVCSLGCCLAGLKSILSTKLGIKNSGSTLRSTTRRRARLLSRCRTTCLASVLRLVGGCSIHYRRVCILLGGVWGVIPYVDNVGIGLLLLLRESLKKRFKGKEGLIIDII
ncbi:hypothetical protein ACMFMG_012194 [Clarireedia jacksonii]